MFVASTGCVPDDFNQLPLTGCPRVLVAWAGLDLEVVAGVEALLLAAAVFPAKKVKMSGCVTSLRGRTSLGSGDRLSPSGGSVGDLERVGVRSSLRAVVFPALWPVHSC